MIAVIPPDAIAVVVAVIAAFVIAIVRRLITVHDLARTLAERVAYLEAKVNGKPK